MSPLRAAARNASATGAAVQGRSPSAPLPVGGRFTTIRRIGGVERAIAQQVAEAARPHRWAARGEIGPIRPSATIAIEPINGGAGSRITFTLDFAGHGIGVPLLPLVRRQTRRSAPVSYRRLKQLLESGRA